MATKSCENTTSHHSSIALLQERFRQLQRAKEMREEKELLRLLSESERTNPAKRFEQTGFFFHSESLLPHHRPSSHQSSIYLQPNLQSKQGNLQGSETSPMFSNNMMSTATGAAAAMNNRTYYNLDDSDVDTSLHL